MTGAGAGLESTLLSERYRQHWQQLCAAETDALERRRALLRQAARAVAADLRQRSPGLELWLFGSVLGPGLQGIRISIWRWRGCPGAPGGPAAALAGADPGGGGGAELMAADPATLRRLRDLATDLALERRRMEALIDSLTLLAERWQRQGADGERVDAAALRLQSLYTGIERSLLLIVRALNSGTPEGPDGPRLRSELQAFDRWLQALIARTGPEHGGSCHGPLLHGHRTHLPRHQA